MVVKAEVLATITDFLASGLPIVNAGFEPSSTTTGEWATQVASGPINYEQNCTLFVLLC